jgi:hypothetical protein
MPVLECAISASSDLRKRAHNLSEVWANLFSNGQVASAVSCAEVRPVIAESWQRVFRLGIDPERGGDVVTASFDEVERRRQTAGLIGAIDILRGGLTSVAESGVHVMVITDADGYLLWQEGSTHVRKRAEKLGFAEGAQWVEGSVGTNGIGTSLIVGRPVQVFAAEHFVRSHHSWVCTAAPVHDPVTGRLIGVVDVAGPAMTGHPCTMALVVSVARLAQVWLRQKHSVTLAHLRRTAAPVLARIGGSAVVVDLNGWVAAVQGVRTGNRVLLGTMDDGEMYIPTMGWCQVEPLFDGWLIRPRQERPERPATARLDLRHPKPVIAVAGPSGSWQHELRSRHAEILLLLALYPGGCTASDLSRELFGQASHTVSVRAEVSRLRREIGSLIETQPYRFPDWLEITCDLPLEMSDLLPQSTSAAIRALRLGGPSPVP